MPPTVCAHGPNGCLTVVVERAARRLPALDHAPQFGLDPVAVGREVLQLRVADRRDAGGDVADGVEVDRQAPVVQVPRDGAEVRRDREDDVVAAAGPARRSRASKGAGRGSVRNRSRKAERISPLAAVEPGVLDVDQPDVGFVLEGRDERLLQGPVRPPRN